MANRDWYWKNKSSELMRMAQRRAKLKALGLCAACGVYKARPGLFDCEACALKSSQRYVCRCASDPQTCKRCRLAQRKRDRGRKPEVAAQRAKAQAAWLARDGNRERNAARAKEWRLRNLEHLRLSRLCKEYGLSTEEAAVLASRTCCDICGNPRGARRALAIDHDHSTGRVRGALCQRCNLMLGHSRDDEALLLKALEYLRRNRLRVVG